MKKDFIKLIISIIFTTVAFFIKEHWIRVALFLIGYLSIGYEVIFEALKNVRKKIDILTYRFNLALSQDDDDATGRVLGEAEMLKSMIISTYANYLGMENLDKIIKNINYLVSEFVKNKTHLNPVCLQVCTALLKLWVHAFAIL